MPSPFVLVSGGTRVGVASHLTTCIKNYATILIIIVPLLANIGEVHPLPSYTPTHAAGSGNNLYCGRADVLPFYIIVVYLLEGIITEDPVHPPE